MNALLSYFGVSQETSLRLSLYSIFMRTVQPHRQTIYCGSHVYVIGGYYNEKGGQVFLEELDTPKQISPEYSLTRTSSVLIPGSLRGLRILASSVTGKKRRVHLTTDFRIYMTLSFKKVFVIVIGFKWNYPTHDERY